MAVPTLQEIDEAQTPAGGWTKATLAGWGIKWPPKKGWRKQLEAASMKKFPNQPKPTREPSWSNITLKCDEWAAVRERLGEG